MATVRSDGLQIDYDDRGGEGAALLLMPGWCDSRVVFERVAPILAKKHRVLALDWRGHGQSDKPSADFGYEELVRDALAVVEAGGAGKVVPVAASHAGWAALSLARRLGPERVPAMVLLDWIILDPPPPFIGALAALQDPGAWRTVRDRLFQMWLNGLDGGLVARHLEEVMSRYDALMWARAGREISRAYARAGSPMNALGQLAIPTLHVYAQPPDEDYLRAQESLADKTGWFQVRRLTGRSHFPALETPDALADAVLPFTTSLLANPRLRSGISETV